jgi:hypothetical protein
MWYFGPEDAALKGAPERCLWPALQGGVFTTLFPQGLSGRRFNLMTFMIAPFQGIMKSGATFVSGRISCPDWHLPGTMAGLLAQWGGALAGIIRSSGLSPRVVVLLRALGSICEPRGPDGWRVSRGLLLGLGSSPCPLSSRCVPG